MSVHRTQPRTHHTCFMLEILQDAAKQEIPMESLGHIVDANSMTSGLQEHMTRVIYDKKIVVIRGNPVKNSSSAVIEFFTRNGLFYYPVYSVRDYGDEGSFDTSQYLCCDEDILLKYASLFDEIVPL